jgi:hypothetical protein
MNWVIVSVTKVQQKTQTAVHRGVSFVVRYRYSMISDHRQHPVITACSHHPGRRHAAHTATRHDALPMARDAPCTVGTCPVSSHHRLSVRPHLTRLSKAPHGLSRFIHNKEARHQRHRASFQQSFKTLQLACYQIHTTHLQTSHTPRFAITIVSRRDCIVIARRNDSNRDAIR